ncbi:MAG: hypothetical protein HQ478_01200 [Chloroflexi bacterium]|nr:hypothetical protein [Chloroflexota bacterium]
MTFNPDINLIAAAMDRIIPPMGDLEGAGGLGLAPEVIERSKTDDRFWLALQTVYASLNAPGNFGMLDGEQQDAALSAIESETPDAFGFWLDVVYTVYYMQPRVHQRLGWHGRTPQPDGNQMPPWNESVLANIRTRAPFWKQV